MFPFVFSLIGEYHSSDETNCLMSKAIFFCSRWFVSKKRSSLNKAMVFFCDSLKAPCPNLSHSKKGSSCFVMEGDGALLTMEKTSSKGKDGEFM